MADAPEWMSVDLSSGTLSGLPLANDVGSLLFELKGIYSDGTEFSQSISLTVKKKLMMRQLLIIRYQLLLQKMQSFVINLNSPMKRMVAKITKVSFI